MSGGELGEEADIVFDEMADVRDAPLEHGEPFEAHAEGEAGDAVRVVDLVIAGFADGFEDGWVDHAAAEEFDPAWGLTFGGEFDVDLVGGFGEGEEVRAEADFGIGAEEGAEEVGERAFEVGEADVGGDVETSSWLKAERWVASISSRRKALPGAMMRTGGDCCCMVRTWTLLVWVRRRSPLLK